MLTSNTLRIRSEWVGPAVVATLAVLTALTLTVFLGVADVLPNDVRVAMHSVKTEQPTGGFNIIEDGGPATVMDFVKGVQLGFISIFLAGIPAGIRVLA